MTDALKDIVHMASDLLRDENGFSRKGRRFVREDELMRSVWFVSLGPAGPGSMIFDVLFDLGIPGISTFSAKAQEWVVRASGKQIHLHNGSPAVKFRLTGGADDAIVTEVALETVKTVMNDFLLRYKSPTDLCSLVKDSALEFMELGMAADNEFKRLRLAPWNVVPRLELAGVYATYLGKTTDAEFLENLAIDYAGKNRIDSAIPRISENIRKAADAARHAEGG